MKYIYFTLALDNIQLFNDFAMRCDANDMAWSLRNEHVIPADTGTEKPFCTMITFWQPKPKWTLREWKSEKKTHIHK